MDTTGIPDLSELYQGITISPRSANRHLKLAFPGKSVWVHLREEAAISQKPKKKKCKLRDHANCSRYVCRDGYELTKTEYIDILEVHVGVTKIGDTESGFDEKRIPNPHAFYRFLNCLGAKLSL